MVFAGFEPATLRASACRADLGEVAYPLSHQSPSISNLPLPARGRRGDTEDEGGNESDSPYVEPDVDATQPRHTDSGDDDVSLSLLRV